MFRQSRCCGTLAATEAHTISTTAESAAIIRFTPEGEHKTPINKNNTIIQTAIIYEWTKQGERVCEIYVCGSDIKCRQSICYSHNLPEIAGI